MYNTFTQNLLKKSKPSKKVDHKDDAFVSIGKYLESTGWKNIDMISPDHCWFQWIDPIHGMSHRIDSAFVLQTGREIYNITNG